MKTEPRQEHRWLHQLIGEWSYDTEMAAGPGQRPERLTGTETVRPLGELWVIAESIGDAPGGGTMASMTTLGYDTVRNGFVGTWAGSMMAYLWVYHGELDGTGRVLTLRCEGPDLGTEGATASYRDILELWDDGSRAMRSEVLGADGEWKHMMAMEYRRTR
jgi:hypothetical protein